MLQLNQVSLRVGGHLLLDQARLTVYPKQKIGLIGDNGCGKSTLFQAILGDHPLDHGEVHVPEDWQIGQVQQELPLTSQSALAFVMHGDHRFAQAQAQLEQAQASDDTQALVKAWDQMTLIEGHLVEPKAQQLMMGLGFVTQDFDQPLTHFSGGWQVRLKLARALMQPADLLLLDEPTNHLDIEAVAWLTQWLHAYQGALLVISHDRHFLDEVVDGIAQIDQQQLHFYSGNFAAFERQRHAQLMQQQALHDKQKQQMQHLKRFVARFRAQASKAKQAQSRIKALERMETVAAVQASNPFHFRFFEPKQLPDPMIRLEAVDFGYPSQAPILQQVSLTLRAGERIGLVGVNGSGKSTFLKLLIGKLTPQQGRVQTAKGVKVAYFAQHQLSALKLDQSPVAHLQQLAPDADERVTDQAARDFLGQFGFSGDKAFEPVKHFSGGEKARLSLGLMVYQQPNVLIMDEPTNHLDMQTRDALEMALQSFSGTMILVTHDQHLLASLVDQYWWVHDQQLAFLYGSLDDYLTQRLQSLKQHHPMSEAPSPQSKKQARREAAQKRQQKQKRLKPMHTQAARLEKDISECDAALAACHQQMQAPSLYEKDQAETLAQVLQSEHEWQRQKTQAETQWLALQEDIEAIEAELEQTET